MKKIHGFKLRRKDCPIKKQGFRIFFLSFFLSPFFFVACCCSGFPIFFFLSFFLSLLLSGFLGMRENEIENSIFLEGSLSQVLHFLNQRPPKKTWGGIERSQGEKKARQGGECLLFLNANSIHEKEAQEKLLSSPDSFSCDDDDHRWWWSTDWCNWV